MRYLHFLAACLLFISGSATANWQKINDVDYVWGPFTIYNLSLFSETGDYFDGVRPVMLTLKYSKPVDGRDFAISLARSWSNLGITLPEQDKVVDRLRKVMPNIKKGDALSYIALEDKGYFVLNDTIIDAEFNQDFNNAVVAVWLDPRVEIGKALLSKTQKKQEMVKPSVAVPNEPQAVEAQSEPVQQPIDPQQGGSSAENFANDAKDEKAKPNAEKSEEKASESSEPSEDEPAVIFPPNDFMDLFPTLC